MEEIFDDWSAKVWRKNVPKISDADLRRSRINIEKISWKLWSHKGRWGGCDQMFDRKHQCFQKMAQKAQQEEDLK